MFCQNGEQRAKETVFYYLKDTLGETVLLREKLHGSKAF